jgi:tRNA nucleotidyltransferase/poly(A) polymerase
MKIIKKYKMFLESKSDMWSIIPQSVKDLNEIFKKSGKKLYLVGGSVRDFLTGDKPKDFDLATDALPDEVIKILQSHNYDFNLQGKAFGVVVVYTDDEPMGMEIATFRSDRYGNSDIEDFILYIQETKPDKYEERIDLLLKMSDKK